MPRLGPSRTVDPALFLDDAVSQETATIVQLIEATLDQAPCLTELGPQGARAAQLAGKPPFGAPLSHSPNAQQRSIAGPGGPIGLRIFRPEVVDNVYLHVHGGAWYLGAADQQDPRLEEFSRLTHSAIVSVDYRLAPEHPYPAALDDCEAAALWLVENASREFGCSRLTLGGESAGAHLCATTLLRLRDKHGLRPFAGANLVFGCYDLGLSPSVRNFGARRLIINTPICEDAAAHFLAGADARDPDVSPLYAKLEGLPPALFTIGTLDPLLDDNLFMHARWLAAGNDSHISIFPGAIHSFLAFPSQDATRTTAEQAAFLREVVQSESARVR